MSCNNDTTDYTAIFKKGDFVRIRKGAKIHSTHPKRSSIISTREQSITISAVHNGYNDGYGKFCNAQITWAGSGSYWRWTDAQNIINY